MNTYAGGKVSILRLMRHDRAFNISWPLMLVAVFLGFLLHVFPGLDSCMTWAPGSRPVEFDLLYLAALSYFVLVVFMTGVIRKSADIYMTMPIPVRRVWTGRYLSMLTVAEVSVALVTLITAFRMQAGEAPRLDIYTLRLGFHTGAAMALLLTLLQLPWMELGKVVRIWIFAAYGAFMTAAVVFAAIITVGITWASWIFLIGSGLIVLWILRALPLSFSVMPAEPEPARAATVKPDGAAAEDASSRRAGRAAGPAKAMTPLKRNLTVARALVNKWNFWLDCLMLLFYAMMVVNSYYNGARDNPWWLFGFIWVFAALMHSLSMVGKVDYLPISRRTFFAMTMTPVIASVLLGLGLGWTIVSFQPHEKQLITYDDNRLQIPLEFYEISSDGPPPVLTSIWGEHLEPESHPVFRGSDTRIYKPFDTGPGSSPRFLALQIDRAAEAIYGIERDPLKTYENLDDGFIRGAEGCCMRLSKYTGMTSETRSRMFAVLGITVSLFYFVLISLQIRYSQSHKAAFFLVPGAVVLILLIIGSVVAADRAGLTDASFDEAIPLIAARKAAEAVPLSTPVMWILFAAVCVLGYFMLEAAYKRFEPPLTPARGPGIA